MKSIIMIAVFMLLLFQAAAFADDDSVQTTRVKVGEAAPDFSCRTLSDDNFSLSGEKGKIVLIHFFSTECGSCLAEMPFLEKVVFKRFAARKDFRLIAIGRDQEAPELEKFRNENKLSFPIAPDPQGKVYNLYAEKNIPRTFLVGKDGKIRFICTGFSDSSIQEIDQAIINAIAN